MFSQLLGHRNVHTSSPFNLIGRAQSKICLEEVDQACLIRSSRMACPSVVLLAAEDVNGGSDPTPCGVEPTIESRPEASSPDPREPHI